MASLHVLHAVLQHRTHGFRSQPHRLRTDLEEPNDAPVDAQCSREIRVLFRKFPKFPSFSRHRKSFWGSNCSYLSFFKSHSDVTTISSDDVCSRNAAFWGCCSQNQAPCDQATDSKDTHPIQSSARIARMKCEIH